MTWQLDVPNQDVDGFENAGAVSVIYGSASGLSATAIPDQIWTQNSPDVEDISEAFDRIGISLEAGDFNNDGRI